MQTQFDHHVRIVSLENLRALCDRVSGMCHRYEVSKVSRSRVHVTYSNPNEYGTEDPITAVFPCYPSTTDRGETPQNPAVAIGGMLRCIGDADGYAYQAFDAITCHASLWRHPETGEWRTRQEIDGTDRYLCPDGQIRKLDSIHPYTDDRFAAFEVTAETDPAVLVRLKSTRHFVFYTWTDLQPIKAEV